MKEKAGHSFSIASVMAGSRSAQITDQQTKSATYYSATVEDLAGRRSLLTLKITGRDPQGAFDWSCSHRGLKRVSDLEQAQEENTMETSNPTNT